MIKAYHTQTFGLIARSFINTPNLGGVRSPSLTMSGSIEASLHAAYTRVTRIEPLSPSASPNAKDEYHRTLFRSNQFIGQMQAHIRGVAEASRDEEEDNIDLDGTGDWGKRHIYIVAIELNGKTEQLRREDEDEDSDGGKVSI